MKMQMTALWMLALLPVTVFGILAWLKGAHNFNPIQASEELVSLGKTKGKALNEPKSMTDYLAQSKPNSPDSKERESFNFTKVVAIDKVPCRLV